MFLFQVDATSYDPRNYLPESEAAKRVLPSFEKFSFPCALIEILATDRQMNKNAENPYFVLMTAAGKQPCDEFDRELHALNRRLWNGWVFQNCNDAWKGKIRAEAELVPGFNLDDLAPLNSEENKLIENALKERSNVNSVDPDPANIEISGIRYINSLNCCGYIFKEQLSIKDSSFECFVTFSTCIFFNRLSFARCEFRKYADFSNSRIHASADFHSANFFDEADFGSTVFIGGASDFTQAQFHNIADFKRTRFTIARFNEAKFKDQASFMRATFEDYCRFNECSFLKYAGFGKTKFKSSADFSFSEFGYKTNFTKSEFFESIDFSNTKFLGSTRFDSCNFYNQPPKYFESELHEDTTWKDISDWPVPQEPEDAEDFILAYERLKLQMDRQKRTHEEHRFLRLELKCRRIAAPNTVAGYLSNFYESFSEYGWSIWRPIKVIFITTWSGWIFLFSSESVAELTGGDRL